MSETNTAENQAPAAAAPVEKAPKDERNGVTRPKADTATGKVWAIADALSTAAGKTAARKDVLAEAAKVEINAATAATQYGRWCKYYGVKAVTEPKPPKEPKAKKEKAKKEDAPAAAPAAGGDTKVE